MNPCDKAPEPSGPAPEAGEAARSQTNRLNAEAIKLVAEANESRARQLGELEDILARLHQNVVAEAERLKQLEEQGNQAAALLAREQQARNQAALDQLRAEGDKVEAARTQALAARQESQRLREETEKIQAQFWPAGVRAQSWGPWRGGLIRRAAAEPVAAILLARLHTAAALESSGRPLPLELVRDLGHSVYEAGPEDAEKLAQALTQAAAGRFDIKTVRVGDRIDKRFMQPSAGGLAEVRAVSGWAIRDDAGKWQFLADVS